MLGVLILSVRYSRDVAVYLLKQVVVVFVLDRYLCAGGRIVRAVVEGVGRADSAGALHLLRSELAAQSLVTLDIGHFRQVQLFFLDFTAYLVFH